MADDSNQNLDNPYKGAGGQGSAPLVVVAQNVVTAINNLTQTNSSGTISLATAVLSIDQVLLSTSVNLIAAIATLTQVVSATFPNFVVVPANATAVGVAGQVAYNSTSFFWCSSSNQWARATGTTVF